jgi:hypothetical protein
MDTNNFFGNMPNTESLLQRGANASQVGYMDPFNPNKTDMSFFDWPNNFGSAGNPQAPDIGQGKASGRRANSHSKISASDTSMPDYSSANFNGTQLMMDFQPLNFVVSNVDDPDASGLAPTPPTNTPNALLEGSFVDELGISINKTGTPGSKSVLLTL